MIVAVGTVSPRDAFCEALPVAPDILERLESYVALLTRWQSAINLIGRDTLDDIWRRHVLDSAQLFDFLPRGEPVITDLGTGAGLPGMVLAIMGAGNVRLVESSGKKSQFLKEAARQTGTDVEIHNARIEALTPWRSDVIVARALAPLETLLGYALPFGPVPGTGPACLFLKGRRAEDELTEAQQGWKIKSRLVPSKSDEDGVIIDISEYERV